MKRKKVGVAMSGGVDSTSCALLLLEKYDVSGFFMRLAQPDFDKQKSRVQDLANRLGIELIIVDLRHKFQEKVLDYFSGSYFTGLTPNPCMICNREIKFGLFMDAIIAAGMDLVATGHYARIRKQGSLFHLLKGVDPTKDQSYFLARLTQSQLSRVLFPLGDRKKEQTYTYIEKKGFHHFRGQESQDICFLDDTKVADFLESINKNSTQTGDIITEDGRILGQHNGLFRYTIGQRRGLGISDTTPWYVVGLDGEKNHVIVGKNDALLNDTIDINKLNWISGSEPHFPHKYQVRIRYSHKGSTATLTKIDDDHCKIHFIEKQRAITPGQFAVIYQDDEVIGSGKII